MSLFLTHTFATNLSIGNVGRLADALSQFFALNPTISVVDLRFSFRRQAQRAQRLTHLVYNQVPAGQTESAFPGGTRYYAAEWADDPSGRRAYQKAMSFFQANPQFVPVAVRFLPPENNDQSYLYRKSLLAIYTSRVSYFGVNEPQVVGNQPPALAIGAVARAGVLGDTSAYPQVLMNVGGDAWPAGAPAPAVKQVDSDMLCHWAGIAPACYGTGAVPVNSTTTTAPIVPCESTTTTVPPTTFTTTTTTLPPGRECCLRATWDCEVILGESTWVLDAASVECVDAEDCGSYEVPVCSP